MYALIENGEIIESWAVLPSAWSNVSGLHLLNEAELAELSIYPVEIPPFEPVPRTHRAETELRMAEGRPVLQVNIVPRPIDEVRSELKIAATATRYRIEVGGITLGNGLRVLTAREDRTLIDQAITNMTRYNLPDIDFKAASGWVKLSSAEMAELGAVIVQHVQRCYSAERAHHEAIDSTTLNELAAYDLNAGWPA